MMPGLEARGTRGGGGGNEMADEGVVGGVGPEEEKIRMAGVLFGLRRNFADA